MDIIDFHVHAGSFPLLRDDIQGLLTNFPFETDVDVKEVFSNPVFLKAYLQKLGVKRAVVLAECGPGTNYSIDSKLIAEFCKADPFFIPFGNINPNHHESPVDEWKKGRELGIKGYKFYPADHDFDPFIDSMWEVYGLCERAGQPIMFHTGLTGQRDASQRFIRPSELRSLVEKYPDLRVVFAHGGKPNWYTEALEMATQYENVFLDTALVPPADVVDWIKYSPTIQNKVLFGSDLPVSGGYSKLLEKYQASELTEAAREAIFFGNASRLLSIELNEVAEQVAKRA
ncbi:amidohydrolase family protein [Allohahella sp. A8]|uniref:amidohydrolase family protein n=1 Tax=Allohahella sp. A8 TaxID=3141461 RepID=UPI003A805318